MLEIFDCDVGSSEWTQLSQKVYDFWQKVFSRKLVELWETAEGLDDDSD